MRATGVLLATVSLTALLLAARARADDPPAPPAAPPRPAVARPAPDDAALSAALAADVKRLAASDLGSRWEPPDRNRAAQWFSDRLEAMGIAPVPGSDTRVFPFGKSEERGWNVAGWIPGEDASSYVLLAGHVDRAPFDVASKRPGADEASGAAAVLSAAADLSTGPRLARSVLVVAFDLSGQRGLGARAWLAAPSVPLEHLAGVVVVDRMGRSLGDCWPGLLCVHGTERWGGIDAVLSTWTPSPAVSVARLGIDFFGAHPTDAAPFEERQTPALLLTSGLSRDEGTARDAPAALDAKALLARTRALAGLVRAIAASPAVPAWVDSPPPTVAEARVVRQIVRRGIERDAGGPEAALLLRRAVDRHVTELVDRGVLTPGERTALRVLALQAFGEMSRPPQ